MAPRPSSEKTPPLLTIAVAVIALLGAILTPTIAGLLARGNTDRIIGATETAEAKLTALALTVTSTPSAPFTPTPAPSATFTATPGPTLSPSAALLAQGFVFLDDFTDPNVAQRWNIDVLPDCQYAVADGQLKLQCVSNPTQDTFWRFRPLNAAAAVDGLAFRGMVTSPQVDMWGKIQWLVNYVGSDGKSVRTYNYSLRGTSVYVTEYDDTKGHKSTVLGKMLVSSSDPHILQVQIGPGPIAFMLDGQPLALDIPPSLPSGARLNYWYFEATVFKQTETRTLDAAIDWFMIKPAQ